VLAARLEPQAATARLVRLTRDSQAGVRAQALRSLATYRDPSLASAAAEGASDSDPNVRVEALATLAALGGPGAAKMFLGQVDRGAYALRRQALLGLARVDRSAAIAKGAAWITDDEWRTRAAGADALGIVGGDTAVAWLMDLLADSDGRVVARAFEALDDADSVRALGRATSLLAHGDPAVRAVALARLSRAPDLRYLEPALAAFGRAQADPMDDARLAAIGLLAAIANLSTGARAEVEAAVLAAHPACSDYLTRRAAQRLPGVAAQWGPAFPLDPGRDVGDYREIVRTILLPAERGERLPELMLDTDRGQITIELFGADAPLTVHAMIDLAVRNFFDGGAWHRVVPDFVIQDGDPRGDGRGGPGFALRDELNRRRYDRGAVGMALSGPDTGGSQFFITLEPQPHLDGGYTVIGRVRSGMEAVARTTQGDRIRTVRSR
jgi:cyclophilin family peptidyl-prolyl cis-trans isomerase